MKVKTLYTVTSSFIGYTDVHVDALVQYLHTTIPRATYTVKDFTSIIQSYLTWTQRANLNAPLVLAQACHETDYFRSWWSQRPRRNPAGLRVTGERKLQLSKADNPWEWQFDSLERLWKRGYAFASWDLSSFAHVAHLCLYIFKDSEMSVTQQEITRYAPGRTLLDSVKYRGVAKQVRGLNGRWAYPGTFYADAICKIANVIETL